MTLTDAQRTELAAIITRDAGANDSWFAGPRGSFSAAAARDRRFLLELVRTLHASEEPQQDASLCACGAFKMHDGRVLHAPNCRELTS